jgi:predicted CopG family antitoxin
MPKPGFKSITVSENVYKKFFKVYEKNKKGLEIKGIRSFSGYLTNMMEEMMVRYEAFAKHAPYMEKIDIDQNRVTLKDNKRNRIVEVLLKDGELQCLLDERADCVHVGFVYSLPELYNMNNEIKTPHLRDML